jgi:hypothetical protein
MPCKLICVQERVFCIQILIFMPELILLFETHDWIIQLHTEAAIPCRSGKEDDHNILRGTSLSKLSAPNEKEIAQSYTSSFPYFVKIIQKFNVGGSCLLVSCSLLWFFLTFQLVLFLFLHPYL